MLTSLSDQELQDNPVLWYLVTKQAWVPERRGQHNTYQGKCPWHANGQEKRASFSVSPTRVHCFSVGCQIRADLLQLIGVNEFGLSFEDTITWEVFNRRDTLLAELGLKPEGKAFQERHGHVTQVQRALSIPGPLQRRILTQLTEWWHEQLLAETPAARRVRAYLRERGISPTVIKRCPVLGYMPYSQDVSLAVFQSFYALIRVSEEDLEQERTWYRERIPGVTDEDLAFLATSHAFAMRLGVFTETGRWRVAGRIIFSCQNAVGETRFYQGRVPPWSSTKAYKFLNPPGIAKYPFQVSLDMLSLEGDQLRSRVGGTLQTESPFGPLVALSHRLTRQAFATLGESSPNEHLVGLAEPIWLAQDNDAVQITRDGRIAFPGDVQARTFANFYTAHGVWSERLLPWKQFKGLDETLTGAGVTPIGQTMRHLLALRRHYHPVGQ